MIGCLGVGHNEQVIHYINAVGKVWQFSNNTFTIGGIDSSSLITIGNVDPISSGWLGFNFNCLYGPPYWSLGLYKVTNSKQPDKYFYLDSRDSDFGGAVYNPDFHVLFDNTNGIYKYRNIHNNWVNINQGEVVGVWQIKNRLPNTSGLQDYWKNCLVLVPSVTQPHTLRLIWVPIPNFSNDGYNLYWRYGQIGNFSLLVSVGRDTYQYTHEGITIGDGNISEYKVQAFNNISTSTFSNIASIGTSGLFKQIFENQSKIYSYQLYQNYPNPFNSTT